MQANWEFDLKSQLETIWTDSLNDEVTKSHWLKYRENELEDLKFQYEQSCSSYEK